MKKIRSLAFCFITVASTVASGQIISLGGAFQHSSISNEYGGVAAFKFPIKDINIGLEAQFLQARMAATTIFEYQTKGHTNLNPVLGLNAGYYSSRRPQYGGNGRDYRGAGMYLGYSLSVNKTLDISAVFKYTFLHQNDGFHDYLFGPMVYVSYKLIRTGQD